MTLEREDRGEWKGSRRTPKSEERSLRGEQMENHRQGGEDWQHGTWGSAEQEPCSTQPTPAQARHQMSNPAEENEKPGHGDPQMRDSHISGVKVPLRSLPQLFLSGLE